MPAKNCDHAGVSARAQKHPLRKDPHHLGQIIGFNPFQRGNTAFNGHAHIVTGITIGNRKHIQFVDFIGIGTKQRRAALRHLCQQMAVKKAAFFLLILHLIHSLVICSARQRKVQWFRGPHVHRSPRRSR